MLLLCGVVLLLFLCVWSVLDDCADVLGSCVVSVWGGGGGCLFVVVIVAVLDCCVVAVLVNLLLYFCEVVYLLFWRDVLFFVLIPSGSL